MRLQVKELSVEYGAKHVSLRPSGFKPDYFASMADAIATECSFLSESATAHAPTSTFKVSLYSETIITKQTQISFSGIALQWWSLNEQKIFLQNSKNLVSIKFKAWTLLVGLMFSSVRDGYYKELRRQRRQSPAYSRGSRESTESLECFIAQHDRCQNNSGTPGRWLNECQEWSIQTKLWNHLEHTSFICMPASKPSSVPKLSKF